MTVENVLHARAVTGCGFRCRLALDLDSFGGDLLDRVPRAAVVEQPDGRGSSALPFMEPGTRKTRARSCVLSNLVMPTRCASGAQSLLPAPHKLLGLGAPLVALEQPRLVE